MTLPDLFLPYKHHQMKDEKPYQVLVYRYAAYKKIRKGATKDRRCHVCDKTFTRASNLADHYKTTIHKEKAAGLYGDDELEVDDKQRKRDRGEASPDGERRNEPQVHEQ
jgi:hypothetical protein